MLSQLKRRVTPALNVEEFAQNNNKLGSEYPRLKLDKHLHTYLVENLLEVGTSERDVKFIR
jgi:hypothetical protein